MIPCDGCGGIGHYEPAVDGFRMRVCPCGVVQSVIVHPQRPAPRQRWANRRGGLHGPTALARVLGSWALRRMVLESMPADDFEREVRRRRRHAENERCRAENGVAPGARDQRGAGQRGTGALAVVDDMSLLDPGGAILSANGLYRYHLWRQVGPEPARAVFVMLNPSTADAGCDDPTIRRCIGFARRASCGWLDVINLYAWRATDPMALRGASDPVGAVNDTTIRHVTSDAHIVVAAWGAWPGPIRRRPEAVQAIVGTRLLCLGTTKDGSPRHPLYVRGDTPIVGWP